MKQWGSDQAEHILIPWHQGAISPVLQVIWSSWQVKSHLDRYFQKTFQKCKAPVHVKYSLPLLFSSLTLYCTCICQLCLRVLVGEKPTNIKTLRFSRHSDLGQYFGLISSGAMQRLNILWQLFLSPSHKCFLLAPSTCRTWGNKN